MTSKLKEAQLKGQSCHGYSDLATVNIIFLFSKKKSLKDYLMNYIKDH